MTTASAKQANHSDVSRAIKSVRALTSLSPAELARLLGASLVAMDKWDRGDVYPSERQRQTIFGLLDRIRAGERPPTPTAVLQNGLFSSRGARHPTSKSRIRDLFEDTETKYLSNETFPPIFSRLLDGPFVHKSRVDLAEMLDEHRTPAPTPLVAMQEGTSAGKNTYTYDAHTYHTKVPPQGIVDFLSYYLPEGGLVLDPFSGSGMTGVAARVKGLDVILNELSPAACFLSHNFTESISASSLSVAIDQIIAELAKPRRQLYTTICRECGQETEIQYTVWSYQVRCPYCANEFVLWDHCRKYGKTVREHKILSQFPCPKCLMTLAKRSLQRINAVPVFLGYKCCRRVQVEHPLNDEDRSVIASLEVVPPVAGFYPERPLPDGVNLNQPKRHGLDRIDLFYTRRNLIGLSHLWQTIHRVEDTSLASLLAFVFTSLYQRVTRLSEFRFWGGSGNTARFNVPFIFNEANVFVTFERKASNIIDHLTTTATRYSGKKAIVCGSATDMGHLPDQSVDFIFTDPPFGANINYSEMNILWESWLGVFTDPTCEAIVNKHQGKTVASYQMLMTQSFRESYRVLRDGHWMLVVFMNSSREVWQALRTAIEEAGFAIEQINIFDKQHGTFKQFVSDNTAGSDLVIHCRKRIADRQADDREQILTSGHSIRNFLLSRGGGLPKTIFLHVHRDPEIDYRLLYSEWLAQAMTGKGNVVDFVTFRQVAEAVIRNTAVIE